VKINAARPARIAAALLLVAGLAACATDSGKEQAEAAAVDARPWDQAEMTRLTAELAQAVRDVRTAWRREPASSDPSSPHRRSAQQLDQSLRELDQRTGQLATRVAGGAGLDDTFNIARNIKVLLNDIDVAGRGIMTSEWMTERVRPAMDLINQIAPYYGGQALFDLDNMERIDRPPRNR
jgi:hypothetical protein